MSLATTAVRADSHALGAVNLIASSAGSWPLELLSVIVTGALYAESETVEIYTTTGCWG